MSEEPIYAELVEPISEINADTAPPRSKWVLALLIISQLIALASWLFILVFIFIPMAMTDTLFFNGSLKGIVMEIIDTIAVLIFPFFAAGFAWKAYTQRKNAKAILWSALLFIIPITVVKLVEIILQQIK